MAQRVTGSTVFFIAGSGYAFLREEDAKEYATSRQIPEHAIEKMDFKDLPQATKVVLFTEP